MVRWGERGRTVDIGLCGFSAIKVPLNGRLFRPGRSLGAPGPQSTALSCTLAIALQRGLRQILARKAGNARITDEHCNMGPAGKVGSGHVDLCVRHGKSQPDVPVGCGVEWIT